MGGEGSGRRPDVIKMAREQFQNNVVEFEGVPLVMPNYSGVQKTVLNQSGLTPGSVIFADSNAKIAEDNANLFWDDTNNRLGVGTNIPGSTLSLSGSVGTEALSLYRNGANFKIQVPGGTPSSAAGFIMGNTRFMSFFNSAGGFVTGAGDISFGAAQAAPTMFFDNSTGNLGIGLGVNATTNQLEVSGSVMLSGGVISTNQTTANGATLATIGATCPGNAAPQEWLTITINGNVRYIPAF